MRRGRGFRAIGRALRGSRRGRSSGRSRGFFSSGTGIITMVLIAVVTIFFVIGVVPELESLCTIDPLLEWSPMTVTMLGLAKWILPVGAIIAVIVVIFRKVRGR